MNIGGRDAYARTAHLLCELYTRMENVALVTGQAMHLPLTQIDLAEALGLTAIHVNRTIKRLRSDGLLSFKAQELVIHDIEELKARAGFNPGYLHSQQPNPAFLTTQTRQRIMPHASAR